MATDPDMELDRTEAERLIGKESGTLFNWLEFPSFLELQKDQVIERPDRVWVNDVVAMLKSDGQAAGIEQAVTMPLRQANLTVEMPKGDSGGRVTEAVEEMLFTETTDGGMTTPFSTVFAQMTYAAAVRRTFHELVWTRREDGKLGYSKIAWRPPSSCELVRNRKTGDMEGFRQFLDWDQQRPAGADWTGFVTIPASKAVVHVHNQYRDPVYGWADLEVTYWAYTLKRQIMQLWITFLDNASQGRVLAYGRDDTEAKSNAKQISRLKGSGVAAVVRGAEGEKPFDILDTSGGGAGQYLDALRYLDGMASQSVMAGWMDLAGAASQSGAGSYALSADQSGIFLASRHAMARELCATVNTQIIWPFVRVNFGPNAAVPRLKVEKIGSDQVDKAMALLTTLGSAQNMNVPDGFLHLLIERVAAYLDLPDDRVRQMIAASAKQARQLAAQAGAPQAPEGTEAGNFQDAVQGALAVARSEGSLEGQRGGPVG